MSQSTPATHAPRQDDPPYQKGEPVALFIPCYIDQFYPQIGQATARLLSRFGVPVVYPEEQTCCGQPAFNSGYWDEARGVIRHFCRVFAKHEAGSFTGSIKDRMALHILRQAHAHGEVQPGARVTSLETAGGEFRIGVRFASGESRPLTASRVIIASGGQSLLKTGSDGAGYGMARKLGHSVLAPYPALVALRSEAADLRALAGISLPVRWRVRDERGRVREERVRELLFTHDGFSGPSILDASHWAVREGLAIEVTWGDIPEDTWREHLSSGAKKTVVNIIADHLPRRLARAMCERAGIDEELRVAQLPRDRRRSLLDHLVRFPLPVSGDHGFRTAEVTGGGIPLGEIAPATLESRKTGGLFLCGEILDVIGRIGGYNFLWAWVTGRLAGESAARAARG